MASAEARVEPRLGREPFRRRAKSSSKRQKQQQKRMPTTSARMSASDAPLGGAEGTCFWLKSELDGDDGGGDGAGEGNAMPSRLFAVGGRGSAGGGGGKGGGGDGSGLYGLGGGGGDGSGLNGKGGGGGGGDGEGGGGGDGDATLCCSRLHSGSLVAANSAAASRRRPHAAPTTPVEQPATVACDPPSSTSMPSATPRDASASIIAVLPRPVVSATGETVAEPWKN
eukprot:scaffold2480_cov122-Isochrysis_galbana.AAC.4